MFSFKVCLFESKIGWIENFGEKMGKKTFFEVYLVGWGGRKINCKAQVFSLQNFLPKIERKLKGENGAG